MRILAQIAIAAVLLVALLAYRSDDFGNRLRHHQTTLLAWLLDGNWPARLVNADSAIRTPD